MVPSENDPVHVSHCPGFAGKEDVFYALISWPSIVPCWGHNIMIYHCTCFIAPYWSTICYILPFVSHPRIWMLDLFHPSPPLYRGITAEPKLGWSGCLKTVILELLTHIICAIYWYVGWGTKQCDKAWTKIEHVSVYHRAIPNDCQFCRARSSAKPEATFIESAVDIAVRVHASITLANLLENSPESVAKVFLELPDLPRRFLAPYLPFQFSGRSFGLPYYFCLLFICVCSFPGLYPRYFIMFDFEGAT